MVAKAEFQNSASDTLLDHKMHLTGMVAFHTRIARLNFDDRTIKIKLDLLNCLFDDVWVWGVAQVQVLPKTAYQPVWQRTCGYPPN